MDEGEFPLDHHTFTVVFPCFMVRGEGEASFACHGMAGGGSMVAVLTDEDSLNAYRRDIGLPERGAMRFTTPGQLLAALRTLPGHVTHLGFDLHKHKAGSAKGVARLRQVGLVLRQLAAQAGGE